MNAKLVELIVQLINTLSEKEQALLKEKLFFDLQYPSTRDLMQLAQQSISFDFLHDEPDTYTLEDGETIPQKREILASTNCQYYQSDYKL